MDPVTGELRRTLGEALADADSAWCVALSGGLDSTVLLHALAALRPEILRGTLRAIHVNHQLHPDAAQWAALCQERCATLGVALEVRVVDVNLRSGEGPEAAARRARYEAFRSAIAPGEQLLTAHHLDDQAETVLLNLMRGSGVTGLAGIPAEAPLGAGTVRRPLLAVPRGDLAAYARGHALTWVEDPVNRDERMDRNYLRHVVLPALGERWLAAAPAIGRSARLCAEASQLLEALAERDGRGIVGGGQVDLVRLRRLPEPRQRNLLRQLCRRQLGSAPAEAKMREGLKQLTVAAGDRLPAVAWPGGEIRRYRERLYLLAAGWEGDPGNSPHLIRPGATLELGGARGRLRLVPVSSGGIAAGVASGGLQVRFRVGGERLQPSGQAHHRELKTLLQERGVVPWMRGHLPLLFAGDRLVAVADLWVGADSLAPAGEPGFRVRWTRHPALD